MARERRHAPVKLRGVAGPERAATCLSTPAVVQWRDVIDPATLKVIDRS